jgi:phage gp36-like protein
MTAAYCTQNDITNRLSADGITYRTDDNPPTALGDVITDAGTTIDEYLFFLYDPVQLATSDWVRERAADIATYLLCERRGNPVPPGIAAKYERTVEKLEQVRLGQRAVPNLPIRKEQAPVLSNVRVRLDPFPRVVVEPSNSTGKPQGYDQHRDSLDWNFDYSI